MSDDFIEKEAQEDEEENQEERPRQDSDEEEEGPEIDQYEKDGFVVDDEEELALGEGNAEGTVQRRRLKKKARRPRTLDEEDLELIEEASGVKIARREAEPAPYHRLKKSRSEQKEFDEIFGSDHEREQLVEEEPEEPEDFDEDEDDLDKFIVDLDEEGKVIKRKKKGARRATSSQMSEARSIFESTEFEMLDEGLQERAPPKLMDIYDPQELLEKYFTPEDKEIQLTDLPEREQLRFGKRSPPAENELKEEAEWIFTSSFKTLDPDLLPQVIIPKIIHVLEFIRKEHMEIPFIFMYRKDYYAPDLKLSDLWDIYDWDEKWSHLMNRKAALRQAYQQANVSEKLMALLDRSQNETEVQDLIDNFQMHYAPELQTESSGKYKRAIRRDLYRTAKKTRVLEFARAFGLTAEQFGENLMNNYMSHYPTDQQQDPESMAAEYCCPEFPDVESVLKAARSALAQELAYDPLVRQSVRSIYEELAQVYTTPTLKGKREVDAFHPYRGILHIEKKPLQAFKSVQFLEILKAEKEGFITMKIEIPQSYHENELLKEMDGLYLSEGYSGITQNWNEHRRQILRTALTNHLYPMLEKEMRQKLVEEARERVATKCSEKLHHKITAGPFKPKQNQNIHPEEVKVLACVAGTATAPTMFALLDHEGEIAAHLKLSNLAGFESDPRKAEDFAKLKSFIEDNTPAVIAIGAQLDARRLYDDIVETVNSMDKAKLLPFKPHVTFVDVEVPRIFQSSARANYEFPDYPTNLRLAISLGRLLLDPLTEIASLHNDSQEILCLKLHSLQNMVGKDYLMKLLERCFINVVNRVGVDINRAVQHKHASGTLQFVSGLGPRKAMHIISTIYRRGGKIASRADLDMVDHVVFTNCAGFIRIPERHFGNNDEVDPLDDTRIHPEDYNLVRKMAADALEIDGEEYIIDQLLKKPKKLETIDLDAFAEELERNGQPRKKSNLYDIKQEIFNAFADPRPAYRDPDTDELFTMLTGETEATLRKGQLVHARVTGILDKLVRCKLDNGLSGIIPVKELSDKSIRVCSDLAIEIGMTMACRITEIEKEKLNVILTSKSSELQSRRYEEEALQELRLMEPYLVIDPSDEAPKTAVKKKPKTKFTTRRIDHPLFQNITFAEAEEFLKSKEPGELVIRPSSRGNTYLTITWKFYENVYVHINILEREKPNAHSLGKSLVIGEEKFEDLDEIVARYIEPMNSFCQEMFAFRNFQAGSQEEVDQVLQERKKGNPQSIPYAVNISFDNPGKFVLSYLPVHRCKHEFVNVTPEGYTFRRQRFTNPEKLIKWFKTHWREPAPQRSPPRVEGASRGPSYTTETSHYGVDQSGFTSTQDWSHTAPMMHQATTAPAYADMDYTSTSVPQPQWPQPPHVPIQPPHMQPQAHHRRPSGTPRSHGRQGGNRPPGGHQRSHHSSQPSRPRGPPAPVPQGVAYDPTAMDWGTPNQPQPTNWPQNNPNSTQAWGTA